MKAEPRALSCAGFFPKGRSRCGKSSLLPHLCQLLSVQRSGSVVVAIENPIEERPGWSSQPRVAGGGPGVFGDTAQSRIFQSRMPWLVEPRLSEEGQPWLVRKEGVGWVASF